MFRKIVSTALIATMLFFVPSIIPSMMRARATGPLPCGTVLQPAWLATDTAFAGAPVRLLLVRQGYTHPCMAVGGNRMCGINRGLCPCRQFLEQPGTDGAGSMDVRLAVLDSEAVSAAAG